MCRGGSRVSQRQQTVLGPGLNLSFLGLDPVTSAFERVVRQRNPATGLAGEEPCEGHREPRLVGPGYSVHEAAAWPRRWLRLAIRRLSKTRNDDRRGGTADRCWQHLFQRRARADRDNHIDTQLCQRSAAAPKGRGLARCAALPTSLPPVASASAAARAALPCAVGRACVSARLAWTYTPAARAPGSPSSRVRRAPPGAPSASAGPKPRASAQPTRWSRSRRRPARRSHRCAPRRPSPSRTADPGSGRCTAARPAPGSWGQRTPPWPERPAPRTGARLCDQSAAAVCATGLGSQYRRRWNG